MVDLPDREVTWNDLPPGTRRRWTLPGGVPMDFAWIPAGTFWMGSPEGERRDNERPRHRVTLTRPCWMGLTPVIQAQWRALAEQAGLDPDPSCYKGADRPVEQVSWKDADRWCSALASLEWAAGARLSTEAEWERACRAGTETPWSCPEGALAEHAWFDRNSGSETHPVGQKLPNPWGLYDTHGNVWEWCADWYGPYAADPAADPAGPPSGDFRVARGGTFWISADWCRSAFRGGGDPGVRDWGWGFRVVLPSSPPPER